MLKLNLRTYLINANQKEKLTFLIMWIPKTEFFQDQE